jgi:hypothetical protein
VVAVQNTFSFNQIVLAAMAAVAVVASAAFASDFDGYVDFNVGTSGVSLQIKGGEAE